MRAPTNCLENLLKMPNNAGKIELLFLLKYLQAGPLLIEVRD
jgi:hypothetical protein